MHDAHTLVSSRTGISKYTATYVYGYMANYTLSLTRCSWEVSMGKCFTTFQLVPIKRTFRQNFSDLPKRLEEPSSSPGGFGSSSRRAPWPGGSRRCVGSSPWCSGQWTRSGLATGSTCSRSSTRAAGSHIHRLGTPKCVLKPDPVFKRRGSSVSSERDKLPIHRCNWELMSETQCAKRTVSWYTLIKSVEGGMTAVV